LIELGSPTALYMFSLMALLATDISQSRRLTF